MPDRVHPAVQGVQAPAFDSPLDRALPEAELTELAPADNPMLGLGERGDRPVGTADTGLGRAVTLDLALDDPILVTGWADFGSLVIPNSAQSLHGPILTGGR